MRSLLVLLLLAMLAGCAAPQTCDLVPLATMPLERQNNLMYVTATIGRDPVHLLVDTGAERTVLTETAVRRLRLQRDTHHVTRSYGIGGTSMDWDVSIPELVLGHTRFPIDHLAAADFTADRAAGPPIDGLLGADILLAFDMDIDAPAERLTLFRVRRCAGASPPWSEPAIRIDGIARQRDRLLVPFALDGVPGMAVLDTGAQATTIGNAMAERLGLTDAQLRSDRTVMVHGAAPNPLQVHVHRFRELRIGNAKIEAPALAVVPRTKGMGDALIGGDFLHGRRVWLSLATSRLYLSAPDLPVFAGSAAARDIAAQQSGP